MSKSGFKLQSKYQPSRDQAAALKELEKNIEA
jgi:excinuclease UvrABC helicase subunit UvrB